MKKLVPKDAVFIPKAAKKVFSGQIFNVYQWPQTMFDGSRAIFEMLKRADTVCVITLVDNKLIVLDEVQPHHGDRINFSVGRVDPNDQSTLAAAQRELLEETGYVCAQWRLLKVRQPHSKIEWFVYTYLASDIVRKAEPNLDAGEKIVIREESFDRVKQMCLNDVGFLGEERDIFDKISSLEELKNLPEFQGQVVDR